MDGYRVSDSAADGGKLLFNAVLMLINNITAMHRFTFQIKPTIHRLNFSLLHFSGH